MENPEIRQVESKSETIKGGAEKVLKRTSKDMNTPSCTVMNNQDLRTPPFDDLGTMQIQPTLILSFAQSVESTIITSSLNIYTVKKG